MALQSFDTSQTNGQRISRQRLLSPRPLSADAVLRAISLYIRVIEWLVLVLVSFDA